MGPGMLRIQPRYLALAALLLGTEVLIARHTHGLLRGFVGDMLVVPLVYALLRATVQWPRGLAAGAALALACLVELMQGLGLPDLLHGLLPGAVQHHALYRVLQIALGWLRLVHGMRSPFSPTSHFSPPITTVPLVAGMFGSLFRLRPSRSSMVMLPNWPSGLPTSLSPRSESTNEPVV